MTAPMKILVMGLPGSGKTTMADSLLFIYDKLNLPAGTLDGDMVRKVDQNVDFSESGRVAQAGRIGQLADDYVRQGRTAICSFVCPTPDCRAAFWGKEETGFTVFMDRLVASAYPDTNRLFVPPVSPTVTVGPDDNFSVSVDRVLKALDIWLFDWTKPTAMLVGRFQPFHAGHWKLVKKAIEDVGQVVIGLRHTMPDEDNPATTEERATLIHDVLSAEKSFRGKYAVMELPNVTKVVYGRTPGYEIEQYRLDEESEAISGSKIRASRREGLINVD